MIPLSDDNPTLRTPVMTYLLLATLLAVWVLVQGAGLDVGTLAASVCEGGLIPGVLTHLAPAHARVAVAPGYVCRVSGLAGDGFVRLFTSMFLHGGWGHLLSNALFFWIFGNNVEDSMGRLRFLAFYLLCGVVAGLTQVMLSPASVVPMLGASGAIAGVLGAYLVLYPSTRVRVFFPPFFFFPLPAWLVLLEWFGLQVLSGLPELAAVEPNRVSGGVAHWAHIGGFVCGVLLIRLFQRPDYILQRSVAERRVRRYGW